MVDRNYNYRVDNSYKLNRRCLNFVSGDGIDLSVADDESAGQFRVVVDYRLAA